MGKYLKLYQKHTEYEAASQNLILPNVSHCIQEAEVHYNPLVAQFFCKLTLQDSSVVELEGEGELTQEMVSKSYSGTLLSAEIGEMCTSIGNKCFRGCNNLTSVTISNSVTSIGLAAFYDCYNISAITIPNSISAISSDAFAFCDGLTDITIPSSVTSIGSSAFMKCYGLTFIDIPNSITRIEEYTFYECSGITSITIPNSVNYIGKECFYRCKGLTSITIERTFPPTLGTDVFRYTSCPIYVPSDSVSTYKEASGWSTYASRIQAAQ